MSKIHKLDENVINKIAAGEIIHRPHNALKELIENSIDAKSTVIQIIVKDGGLKLLQIHDNGSGIEKSDLDIVCERFTTSKITNYEDLNSIQTYGFRGEALASISQVSHVTIISKTAISNCAYKCSYIDSKPRSSPQPCAGNQGTQITIEDLFYNLPTRRKSLSQPSQEYSRICDVVMKYAIHNSHVSFALKKAGSQSADVKTTGTGHTQQLIQSLYGAALCKNLVEVKHEDKSFGYSVRCLLTDPKTRTQAECKNQGKTPFLLFINHRLVDCQPIRRLCDSIYGETMSDNVKGGRATNYFAYLDLRIDPQNVDVNIHPTKKEVCFLYQEEIILAMRKILEEKILGYNTPSHLINTVQSVYVNSQLQPTALSLRPQPLNDEQLNSISGEDAIVSMNLDWNFEASMGKGEQNLSLEPPKDINLKRQIPTTSMCPQYLNRTDFKSQKLDRFMSPKFSSNIIGDNAFEQEYKDSRDSVKTDVHELASISALKKGIYDEADWSLTKLIREHVFVGPVDYRYALVQRDTSLYVADTQQLARELYYQIIVRKFGKMGRLKMSYPLSTPTTPDLDISSSPPKSTSCKRTLKELALLGLDRPGSGWLPEHGSKEECAHFVQSLLSSKAEMLDDYFSLRLLPITPKNSGEMTDGHDYCIATLPLLIPGEYDNQSNTIDDTLADPAQNFTRKVVSLLNANLDDYVLRLATEVEWDTELECFKSFAEQTANFLASKWSNTLSTESNDKKFLFLEGRENEEKDEDSGNDNCIEECRNVIEKIIYPAFKKYLVIPRRMTSTNALVKIADLIDLYKNMVEQGSYFEKRKKTRTIYSEFQLLEMETLFKLKKYLTVSERAELALKLGLTQCQIKIWFQNRRTKWKKTTSLEKNEVLQYKLNAKIRAIYKP